jgi:hypothetical protein
MDAVPRLDALVAHIAAIDDRATPLDQLAAAVRTAEHLGELADHLIGHFVDAARQAGASWTDIGQSLGVSKQAVQKRFVANASSDLGDLSSGRFARFTQRAKSVVVHAQQQAGEAGHDSVGSLHVLLGLLHERDALAAKALVAQGVSLDGMRATVQSELGPSGPPRAGHIPFGTDSKQLLERTLREALLLGHNYIGTEHVLLAMLSDPGQDAGRILDEAGVAREPTRAWLVEQLRQH